MAAVMEMSDKVKRLRGPRSYNDVAKEAGCSDEHIRRIEAGTQPGVKIALGLARSLGVPLDWLADDAADWPPPASTDEQIVQVVRDAMAAAAPAGLDADERKMLTWLRELPDDGRSVVWGYVQAMVMQYARSTGEPASRSELADAVGEAVSRGQAPDAKGPPQRRSGQAG